MILSLLALQALAPQAVPPASDVVVIARKAREWRGTFKADKNGVSRQCRTRTSTGDAEIDALACRATVTCYTELHPRIAQIMAATKSRKEANAQLAPLMKDMEPCLDRMMDPMVTALADKRAAARNAGS